MAIASLVLGILSISGVVVQFYFAQVIPFSLLTGVTGAIIGILVFTKHKNHTVLIEFIGGFGIFFNILAAITSVFCTVSMFIGAFS